MSGGGSGGAETPAAAEAASGAGGPRRDGPAHLVIKGLGEIHSRLLDHRPVIQGETRYFLKEFEEKRGLRELRALEKLQSVIGETSEQTLPTCADALRDLGPVLQRLAAASEAVGSVQRREQEWRRVQQQCFSAREQRQAQRLDELRQEQRGREAAADEEHQRARARLQAQYARMEQELGRFAAF